MKRIWCHEVVHNGIFLSTSNGGEELRYRAPSECPEDKIDTIEVYNTCEQCQDRYINVANIGIVGDAFEIVPALTKKFEAELS